MSPIRFIIPPLITIINIYNLIIIPKNKKSSNMLFFYSIITLIYLKSACFILPFSSEKYIIMLMLIADKTEKE